MFGGGGLVPIDIQTYVFFHREVLRYRSNKTLFSRIELFSSIVLSPRVANYKNDIHKFL